MRFKLFSPTQKNEIYSPFIFHRSYYNMSSHARITCIMNAFLLSKTIANQWNYHYNHGTYHITKHEIHSVVKIITFQQSRIEFHWCNYFGYYQTIVSKMEQVCSVLIDEFLFQITTFKLNNVFDSSDSSKKWLTTIKSRSLHLILMRNFDSNLFIRRNRLCHHLHMFIFTFGVWKCQCWKFKVRISFMCIHGWAENSSFIWLCTWSLRRNKPTLNIDGHLRFVCVSLSISFSLPCMSFSSADPSMMVDFIARFSFTPNIEISIRASRRPCNSFWTNGIHCSSWNSLFFKWLRVWVGALCYCSWYMVSLFRSALIAADCCPMMLKLSKYSM